MLLNSNKAAQTAQYAKKSWRKCKNF